MNRMTIAVSAAAFLLGACSSKNDANEENFKAALDPYLAEVAELCQTARIPQDVPQGKNPTADITALRSVGLLKEEKAVAEGDNVIGSYTSGPIAVIRYTLTEAAKPYIKEQEELTTTTRPRSPFDDKVEFCIGTPSVSKIVRWSFPNGNNKSQADVTFTYHINNLPDWANNPAVLETHGLFRRAIEGMNSLERTETLILTSDGWRAKNMK